MLESGFAVASESDNTNSSILRDEIDISTSRHMMHVTNDSHRRWLEVGTNISKHSTASDWQTRKEIFREILKGIFIKDRYRSRTIEIAESLFSIARGEHD